MSKTYPEVLIVNESTTHDQLYNFITTGEMPTESVAMTFDEFKSIGRVEDCDCGLIQCVCNQSRQHHKNCPLRLSMTCAVPFDCNEHGLDVCEICTPCTCTKDR